MDETDDVLRDPGAMKDVQEWLADLKAGGRPYSLEEVREELTARLAADRRRRAQAHRAHLLGEMTRNAVEDGLYDASAEDYTEALRRARGTEPSETPEDSQLTERVNAAIEESGQDADDIAWATEMSRRLLDELDDHDCDKPARSQPVRQIVSELNAELGATLVAALSGSRKSKEPYRWESGETRPDEAAETRLRLAYALWCRLADEESPDVARAFFVGSNPVLNDDTIITALREGRFREARAAVNAFITDTWTA